MREGVISIIVLALVLFSIVAVAISYTKNTNIGSVRGIDYWSGEIDIHIEYFKCDPDLDTGLAGDPDPYFRVFVNDQEIKSPVWDGEDEFRADWWANFTVTTRDKVVWIEIAAWDDDSLLTFRDDLIDISPTDSFALDLLYNLETKSWAGDVTGNNASGNQGWDWGKIAFEIYSHQSSQSNGEYSISLPYNGFGRLDSSQVYLDSSPANDYFKHPADNYHFYADSGKDLNITMLPNPRAKYSLLLYDPNGNLVAQADSPDYGQKANIIYHTSIAGTYHLQVKSIGGYGEYELAINSNLEEILDTTHINVSYTHAYLLSEDWSNINMRMMGYHVEITITNPSPESGYVFINVVNLDPDFVITNYENSTYRGKYSLRIILQLNASETKDVTIHPWYEPTDDFWIFALGDNRPGCGILDNPFTPSTNYTLFMYYYTHVIKTPIGWDDGDLVAGFGGGLVAEYDSVPESDLDYVYDTEYNRFYMLTGLSDVFYFTTVGNHDVTRYEEHPQHQGEEIYKEYLGSLYYSFNFSNTHFVFPDDYQDGYWSDGTPWWYSYGERRYGGYIYEQQFKWLENDLKIANESDFQHRIVVMHMPLIVPPWRDESLDDEFINYTNRLEVMQLFAKYRVDYLVVAHIHNYTWYYTNLEYVNGELNVTSSNSPEGEYSVFTLLTGGAGAHNNYEWIVSDIEGSYHFVLIHVQGSNIMYYVYKYENLTDSDGNPLTSVIYKGANDGSEVDQWGEIRNSAIYSFPYIRMKFYMYKGYDDYVAYSNVTGTYQHVYQHKFKDYTVVYVETSVNANQVNYIHVYRAPIPEFPILSIPMILLIVVLFVVGFSDLLKNRKRDK